MPPLRYLVRDAGFEPASSRLKGECISLSANPAQNLVGDAGIELEAFARRLSHAPKSRAKPRDLSLKRPIRQLCFAQLLRAGSSASAISASHPCQTQIWCRMLESNQHLAIIDRGLPPQHANTARAGDPGGSAFELILPIPRFRFAQLLRASSGAPFGS